MVIVRVMNGNDCDGDDEWLVVKAMTVTPQVRVNTHRAKSSGERHTTLVLPLWFTTLSKALSRAPTNCWSLWNTSEIMVRYFLCTSSKLSTNWAGICQQTTKLYTTHSQTPSCTSTINSAWICQHTPCTLTSHLTSSSLTGVIRTTHHEAFHTLR